jgi:quercetin dioxygenase-like cupin family protein
MTIIHLGQLREQLKAINPEMHVATAFKGGNYQAGLIAFQPRLAPDDKFITHTASDVLAHVLEGRGRLRLSETEFALEPGSVCHIPANTAHDFVAEGDTPLLLFYAVIEHGQKT